MLEYIILGAVQGIVEWLPVSSEGVIALIKVNFFPSDTGLFDIVKEALFLHLGTALAAIVYFRHYIRTLIKDFLHYDNVPLAQKNTIQFLIISTVISGLLGLVLLNFIPDTTLTENTAKILTAGIGILLFITAGIQLYDKNKTGTKTGVDICLRDSTTLGIAQGFAAVPGLSRSGLTVASLLLLGYTKKESLRLSFLMSIPIVLAGNILLNINEIHTITLPSLVGLAFSFIFGIITIDVLLKLAKRMNFGYFVLFFAILTLAAAFI